MRRTARLAALALCLLATPAASLAQFDPYGRWELGFGEPVHLRFAASDSDALLARWRQVAAANGEQADEWAGDYVEQGELSYRVLRWSPRAGFVSVSVHTCEPMVTAFAYGGVTAAPDLIGMRAETRRSAGHHQHHGATPAAETYYLPVRWGERRYLVPQKEVRQFYNFVAGYGWRAGEWPSDFLLRAGDGDKPVSGMPVLPPGYERHVRLPINANVTRVGRREVRRQDTPHGPAYSSLTTITLDAGREHGVRPGMTFYLVGSDYPETIGIARVGRRTTVAVVEREWAEGIGEAYKDWREAVPRLKAHAPLAVGSRLTTSFEIYHSETTLRGR